MEAKYFAIGISILLFLFVLELIRRQKMTFKYSLSWLSGSAVVLFFAFNDEILTRVSNLAGFRLPSNFVFFLLLAFFAALSLLLTIYINEQNNRSETLAQAVGILDYKVRKLQKREK